MSEQRFIDARETVKTLKWYLETNEENGVVYIPDFAVKKIINLPTIDPETLPIVRELRAKLAECEPVHAHWEIDEYGEFRCSNCKGYASMDILRMHSVKDKFCRNCGAKMDEKA